MSRAKGCPRHKTNISGHGWVRLPVESCPRCLKERIALLNKALNMFDRYVVEAADIASDHMELASRMARAMGIEAARAQKHGAFLAHMREMTGHEPETSPANPKMSASITAGVARDFAWKAKRATRKVSD